MSIKNAKWAAAKLIDRIGKIGIHYKGEEPTPFVCEQLNQKGKALLLCLDNLGDAVMATPTIEALKSVYPRVELTVVTRPQSVGVFTNNPHVNDIVADEAPWWSEHALAGSLRPRYWMDWFRKVVGMRAAKYDVVIDLRGDIRHLILFGVAIRPKILLGYGKTGGKYLLSVEVPYDPQKHEIDKKLDLMQPLGIRGMRPQAKIWIRQEEVRAAQKILEKYVNGNEGPFILMDPGAKPIQQWPIERFARLAKNIRRYTRGPILVSAGPAYFNLAETLAEMTGQECTILINPMDTRKFIALVAVCDIVISADTGVVHIAGAVGTRSVTLFGPTEPGRFWHGVYGGQIVKSPHKCCVSELHENCQELGHRASGACMLAISEEMVEKAVYKALGKNLMKTDN
jgi:ADP-heptose:LPS heptosyltransferase